MLLAAYPPAVDDKLQALLAIVLSLVLIVIYVWVRFGARNQVCALSRCVWASTNAGNTSAPATLKVVTPSAVDAGPAAAAGWTLAMRSPSICTSVPP